MTHVKRTVVGQGGEQESEHPLRRWRRQNGVSLRTLAKRGGVSATWVLRVEKGISGASLEKAERVSAATGGAVSADEMLTGPDDSCVYFVRAGEGGPIKVGVARSDVQHRMASLQCGCPHVLELMGTIRGGFRIEGLFKLAFRESRIHGEWFKPDAPVLEIVNLALKSPDFFAATPAADIATVDALVACLDQAVERGLARIKTSEEA